MEAVNASCQGGCGSGCSDGKDRGVGQRWLRHERFLGELKHGVNRW